MSARKRAAWAGWAGVLAALCWIAGDVLIVGHVADRAAFPLLFQTWAGRIDADMAEHVVGVPTARLIAGALCGVFSVWLYLVGNWHLWCGMRACGRIWKMPAIALIFVGCALSPLPHAAFYFVGATYQELLVAPPQAHAALLALADEFRQVLLITWMPAVLCQMLGMLWLSFAIASGRSAWPRWMAITVNPIVLGAPIACTQLLLPMQPFQAIAAASFNVMWLVVYAQSLALMGRYRGEHSF
ncbi:DUF6796 family protein [Xylophilus sp.]|uniref:DUF6796 family protein n=1 Tax=Xylophilus sp. TaxID=2653893 RepID=UPI0013BAC6EE|nr:DUF6796 family protein [Xylophilus sp.]KAF1049780.1 MAG: hypothetical protein GAK38_00443 [Xylophilus sp.]